MRGVGGVLRRRKASEGVKVGDSKKDQGEGRLFCFLPNPSLGSKAIGDHLLWSCLTKVGCQAALTL